MKKDKPKQIRINAVDIKDLIRDEIYGADIGKSPTAEFVIIPRSEVKHLAKRIANRAFVGH